MFSFHRGDYTHIRAYKDNENSSLSGSIFIFYNDELSAEDISRASF
jgi:hypothetical protein